jgi:large conductance mechanosensitive channel
MLFMSKKPKQGVSSEFRAFILRGNVVDLAIAVAIGAAFTAVVTSLSAAFITPIIGALFGKDFAHLSFTINDSKFQYGLFINAVISFLITGTVLFFVVVKPTQHLLRRLGMTPVQAPEKASCPRCLTEIPILATRCQACTSELQPNWSLNLSE